MTEDKKSPDSKPISSPIAKTPSTSPLNDGDERKDGTVTQDGETSNGGR